MYPILNNKAVRFSFFPTVIRDGRTLVNAALYTWPPWSLIATSLCNGLPGDRAAVINAYMDQGREFFDAAMHSTLQGAQPLLYYYAFMNIAKALAVAKTSADPNVIFAHGLSPDEGYTVDLNEQTKISVTGDHAAKQSVFAKYARWVAPNFTLPDHIPVNVLAGQCVMGHPFWSMAANVPARFVRVREIAFLDRAQMTVICDFVDPEEAPQSEVSLPTGARLTKMVTAPVAERMTRAITLSEMADKVEAIRELAGIWKPYLWRIATTQHPTYRDHFLYKPPTGETPVPQLVSLYALFFYFGSLTRYQPAKFRDMARGKYGPFLSEVLTTVPTQFLYLLSSEILQQEVVNSSRV